MLQHYYDAATQATTEPQLPAKPTASYLSYFSCSRLKAAVFGCACGVCPQCKPSKSIAIPAVNHGEFVIHVPSLHRTAEQIVGWFRSEVEVPFMEHSQWKALLRDTFATQLESKLFKMYLKNGRTSHKQGSWLWNVKDRETTYLKISKEPIDTLDWTMHNLSRLVGEFRRLVAYLEAIKAPNYSRQEELRINLLRLTQSFIDEQVQPKVAAIKQLVDGSRLTAFN